MSTSKAEIIHEQMGIIAQDQLELAGMIERDKQLALVALSSFVTAYELLKTTAA